MPTRLCWILIASLAAGWGRGASADEVAALRLVPFPKKCRLEPGTMPLDRPLVLEAPAGVAHRFARMIGAELRRAGLPELEVRAIKTEPRVLRLSAAAGGKLPSFRFRDGATPEDYALAVSPEAIVCGSPGEAGLFYGVATLCQLLRANRRDGGLPCLSIWDWPSLRWRCFQDDMTRGPSSTLDTLKYEVALGARLKMNLFTYYMEYQYAFKKHPVIGPEDGSLEPEDLRALVEYARPLHVDILGNQQSFGHFARILAHQEYAPLRETPGILCPVKEESYQLLDEMYSEVCPILPFEFFNVCCDETYGLGSGPSKELAEKIGVGGVYVGHIRRIHDLLKEKYGKRMMMWGDIILRHPDHLKEVPKDTIMLTWGYGARESFENQIIPFAESGYEFFVCPGVSNWSRILPDFGVATTNIRNFVRDGAKHGAIGMLNTAWEDDGEAINAPRCHGDAWGAECAWNASTTEPGAFNRRIGAVLFGERGDHFGQAVELLAQTHRLPGMNGMNNRRFWENDFKPSRSAGAIRTSAGRLLEVVRPAIEHLEACKAEATVNAELLDSFLFGARRMEWIGQRMLDGLEAARLYNEAYETGGKEALESIGEVETLVRTNRDALESLGREFRRLWLMESKPYALDWTMKRYAGRVRWYDDLLARLAAIRKDVESGKPIPEPGSLGLALPEAFTRRTRPQKIIRTPLEPDTPWAEPSAGHRLGMLVNAGPVERSDLPVQVDAVLPEELLGRPVRAFSSVSGGPPQEIPAQLDPAGSPGKGRLSLLIPGPIPKNAPAAVHVYLGLPQAPKPLPLAVRTGDGPEEMKWIENDRVRLLLGSEGAHVYRWEVKACEGRDLTMPGTTDWSGFADAGRGHRSLAHQLVCTARGPAMVEYACTDELGQIKTIRLFAGTSWMEVVLNEPVEYYWDFDNPQNFAADGPTPGEYLFANGATGPVGKEADGVPAQVKAGGVHWAVKFNQEKLALGMTTPEVAASFVVAPGAGAGGVGIERSPPASHFVTFAGLLEAEPKEVMEQLRRTLDFKNQPEVILHALQARP